LEVRLVKLKLLVTGAGGLLGSAVALLATSRHTVYSAFNEHLPLEGKQVKLNLLDSDAILTVMKNMRPNAVIHSAALTDVDKCEREHDIATKINEKATKTLSDSAKRVGAFFLYVSSDYVFDGNKGSYKENDKTNPVNFYGLTKLRGEESVRSSGVEFCIARGSVIYGARPAAGKANFALWVADKLRNGERVKVLKDQYVSPTLNQSMADMILEAVERRLTGTFHLAGASRVSRYEFAVALADVLGIDGSLIEPAQMKDMHWPAKRPRDSSLDVSKANSTLKSKPLLLSDAMSKLKLSIDKTGDK
jgi:dTDP-4-dehydrorhamnose reductase